MQRFAAFDPPEYVHWTAGPEVVAEYRAQLEVEAWRRNRVAALPRPLLLELYRGLVRNRLRDIQLKRWVMQGVLSKAWLGTGEEAVTIGAVHALRRGRGADVVGPMIRNAGACHEMGMAMADLLRIDLGTADTPLGGRDLHAGDLDHGVIAPISMVGSLVPVCAGIALAFRQRGEPRVALTWVGDGAARTGECHEGLSLAAAGSLPLVVILQDNRVALGTAFEAHSRVPLTELARAYVADGAITCHGNNVLDVHVATARAVERCRAGEGPAIVVATTGRMGGHATHDEGEARRILPAAHFRYWGARDPVALYEHDLIDRLDAGSGRDAVVAELAAIEAEVLREIEDAAAAALASREQVPAAVATVADGVYAATGTVTPER
jgi:TPP-dependent pyruvate/acetoin dehydrogenase alpha subunit